jgi:hypothetical protein
MSNLNSNSNTKPKITSEYLGENNNNVDIEFKNNNNIDYYKKYDRYIGLGKFSDKNKLSIFKNKLQKNLQKERPLLKEDVDNYNKYILFNLINSGVFKNKKKAMYAIKFGKTEDYIIKFPDDNNFKKLIKNIYIKYEIGKK